MSEKWGRFHENFKAEFSKALMNTRFVQGQNEHKHRTKHVRRVIV